jgi:peptidyl-prolyl cis-trans isomerase SurA
MIIRTKKCLSVLLLVLSCACAVSAQAATSNRKIIASTGGAGIAATVNDGAITLSDVKDRMKLYLSGSPQTPPLEALKKMQEQVLDKLIDEKLQIHEATALGITVGEDQMAEAFAQIAQQNHFAPDIFKKRLAAEGVRIGTLNDQLKAEIAWSQVIRRKLRPQINVSENEIDNAMDQLVRNRKNPQYHVAEIFLSVANPAQDVTVRAEAEKIIAQVAKGAHFSDIAREFSQAPGAAQGGELGWIQEGQLDPKLDAALKQMHPGQISRPVRTENGYHILFLRDAQQPGSTSPAATSEAAPPLIADIAVRLKQILIPIDPKDPETIIAAKLARAQKLKSEVSSCESLATKSKEFASPSTGDLPKMPLGELPPSVKTAVENLKIGELSAPVRTDKGLIVFMVCERDEPEAQKTASPPPPIPKFHDKADQAAREEIANKLGMQRLDQMQDRYLRDLRATAFIEKRI